MIKNEKTTALERLRPFIAGLLLGLPLAANAMTPMTNEQLSATTGQALLTADYIAPNSLGVTDPNTQMPIGFYRMGLDAIVETNVNINKLQLGCGGFNNNIKVGCDIDLDYVSMLGLRTASSNQDDFNSNGDGIYMKDAFGNNKVNPFAGAPATSDFRMKRPYVTIAVAHPNDPTKREVVGFKFGAQSVTGYMGIGRIYQAGETNLETGETCVATNGDSLGCHSGLNSLSGAMHVIISGAVPIEGSVLGGAATIDNPADNPGLDDGSNACFGNTNLGTNCSAGPGGTSVIATDIVGTRINGMNVNLPTHAHAEVTALSIIPLTLDLALVTKLKQNLRFIHGFKVDHTGDFFLSFQRQQVSWPKYDKTGYAIPANAGWWMNIPKVLTEDLRGATLHVNESGIPSTLNTANLELFSVPPVNCYGGYKYC